MLYGTLSCVALLWVPLSLTGTVSLTKAIKTYAHVKKLWHHTQEPILKLASGTRIWHEFGRNALRFHKVMNVTRCWLKISTERQTKLTVSILTLSKEAW